MPMQEFLASYAVQVDEDGSRRLQSILDQNREAGEALAGVFESARSALMALKKELSESDGLGNLFPKGTSGGPSSGASPGSSASGSGASAGASSLASAALSGFTGSLSSSFLSVGADFSSADDALSSFISRLESERPRLSVNPSGITSAVSSAVASIRTMMSSVRISVPTFPGS